MEQESPGVAVPETRPARRHLERLNEFQRAAKARARAVELANQEYDEAVRKIHDDYSEQSDAIAEEFDQKATRLSQEYTTEQESIRATYNKQINETREKLSAIEQQIAERHQQETEKAAAVSKDARWETMTVFDAAKGNPKRRRDEAVAQVRQVENSLRDIASEGAQLLAGRHQKAPAASLHALATTCPPQASGNPSAAETDTNIDTDQELIQLTASRDECVTRLRALGGQWIPALFAGGVPVGVVAGVIALATVAAGFALGWQGMTWLLVGSGVGLVLGLGLLAGFWPLAKKQTQQEVEYFMDALNSAQNQAAITRASAEARSRHEADQIVSARDQGLAAADIAEKEATSQAESWKRTELSRARDQFEPRLAQLQTELESKLAALEEHGPPAVAKAAAEKEERLKQLADDRDHQLSAAEAEKKTQLAAAGSTWQESREKFSCELTAELEKSLQGCPPWQEISTAKPASELPETLRFGTCRLDLRTVKHAVPADGEDSAASQEQVQQLAAQMAFAEHPGLIITAPAQQQNLALDVLRNMMLRLLTSAPAGRIRFTILDPLGMGNAFATFSHLADYEERLINGRIWTEPRQIESRLGELAAHMENVIQNYLRGQFATLREYNAAAGEVAEPYQVLVIAGFPHRFSDTSLQRLESIVRAGARCGVIPLIYVDRDAKLPADCDLSAYTSALVHLDESQEQLVWRYGPMQHMQLELDLPPDEATATRLVQQAGEAALAALHVEVPFEFVAPAENEIGQGSCDDELLVPVGKTGAGKKQLVRLGRGTAQHMLISGKTGSGKSTFMHAFVTNAALHYSPDEVQFYLIDFKKGVEFKAYAHGKLPHARVVAIESEREFGVSVLNRLDEELTERGEEFRRHGAQSLADYRRTTGQPLPRIVLVIDEFQELFTQDDRLAQQASLLLDRLVRQGRAFGIHVVLGSQTLAGAYSLARSTLGQMAVRVALQCSEADAHLILSEENTAARLLARPGDAIYNDQSGLTAGNEPFQVVWLSDATRQQALQSLTQRYEITTPQVVFEGNVAADVTAMAERLAETPRQSAAPTIYLGDAVAIKPPTAVEMVRQAGSHLLVVGRDADAALGICTAAIVSWLTQSPTRGGSDQPAPVTILQGSRPDTVAGEFFAPLAKDQVEGLDIVTPGQAETTLARLAETLSDTTAGDEQPRLLVIDNLAAFRSLRKPEDDFSFSSMGSQSEASPYDALTKIIREGPEKGLHTIIWAESYNAVSRAFERTLLREFNYRVALQMNAGDSSSLIDSPDASRLGQHRALLFRDDEGTREKFRPYGPPPLDWLADQVTTFKAAT